MKQFTYKFFCLLSFLLIGGGNLTAQTLTKITSLEEINETDSYVLQYSGNSPYFQTSGYFYATSSEATQLSGSASYDLNKKGYYFQFEINSDGTYQIKNELATNHYLVQFNFVAAPQNDWKILYNSSSNAFCVAWRNVYTSSGVEKTNYKEPLYTGSSIAFVTLQESALSTSAYINIYKVETVSAVDVTINYLNETGSTITTKAFTPNKGEKSLSDLLELIPSYINAKFYLVGETETEVADINAKISEDATYKVVTSYNENFTFPQTSNEYFALKMGNYYLGTYFGITEPNNENKYSIATTIDGDWYNGYYLIALNGKKLYYDGTNIKWSDTEDYKWKISNDMKFTIQDGTKYLAVYSTNCLPSSSYAAELASADAATSILSTVTATEPEYVGQLPYETSGLTFDQIVKGIDFTNGTYYFIENATNANTVLSSSDAKTTFGGAPTSATIATKASKGFNELWQYQDGKFVHSNSGLKLTPFALYNTGNTWAKTATGTAQAYKLNNGTTDLTVDSNDTWKFRLAKSVTINLTEKDGTSYATTCAPVALTLPEEDTATKLYIEKSHTENTLSVEPATAVAANTGIYIENTSGATSATLLFTESGAEPSAETPILHGTNVTLDISSDNHSLYRTLGFNSADKIGFFKPADSITQIPANRAFLHFTTAPTSAFYIDFDGTTTGIDTLLPAAETELDKYAPVYDLSGRRILGTLRTGIYLQNGRKFMVK